MAAARIGSVAVRLRNRIWATGVGFLPLLFTVATLAPLAAAHTLGVGFVVLGAAICLTGGTRRSVRPAPASTPAAQTVRVVAAAAGVTVLALAFAYALWLGNLVYLAALLGSRLASRLGPRWAQFGRALLLPLTALFIAPPLRVPGAALAHVGWALAASLIACLWLIVVPLVLREPRPREGEVVRALAGGCRSPWLRSTTASPPSATSRPGWRCSKSSVRPTKARSSGCAKPS
jgi:hypothetical protein